MRNGISLPTTTIDLLRDADAADDARHCCRAENLFSTLNLGALKRTTTTPSPEVPKAYHEILKEFWYYHQRCVQGSKVDKWGEYYVDKLY